MNACSSTCAQKDGPVIDRVGASAIENHCGTGDHRGHCVAVLKINAESLGPIPEFGRQFCELTLSAARNSPRLAIEFRVGVEVGGDQLARKPGRSIDD